MASDGLDRGGSDISIILGATFHHVLRKANFKADTLAKEGVLLTSMMFYVSLFNDVLCLLFLCFSFRNCLVLV